MHELFDMVAGTSSGSIVAAGVSFPSKDKTAMSGADISAFIEKHGEALFERQSLLWGLHIAFWVIIALFFACIGYWLGKRRYDNPKIDYAFDNLDMVISNTKRQIKGRE